jgi:hypothetical protein
MAKYNYTYHEERGEFHGYVEDSNGKTIWEVHYPDFYEDEETGELVESSTIFDDGIMKYQNDVEGLEKYLKAIRKLKANDELVDNDDYAEGGDVEQGNLDMVKNQVIQVEHHAKELMETLKSNPQVDAWVVAKMDRATSNLSDITHYLEGNKNSFDNGGVTTRRKKLDDYETYHKTLASALQEAERFVNNRGYEFSEDKYFPDLTMGGVPYGQTISTKRDLVEIGGKNRKNTLILVVYRMDSGTYELLMYFAKSNFAKGGGVGFDQYGNPYGFDYEMDSVYEWHHKEEDKKNPYKVWDKIEGVYVAEFPSRQRAIEYIERNRMADGGETKFKKVRTLSEAQKDPRVENIYFEPDDYREISGSYWLELKEGYICRSMSCGTIHEDTLKKVLDLLNNDVVKESEYASGGETSEGIDLFEDYEKIPANVQKILDKYEDAFMDGDYKGLEKAHKELGKIGYEFEYYLDGQAYDLRPIGTKGKTEYMAKGGGVDDKKVIELTPIYTTRDKKGFRFYSTDDGKQLYAEKNGDIYNVNEDTLKPTTIIPLQRTRFKFVGLINDNDVKDLNPLHYERETQKRIEKSFGMAKGGVHKVNKKYEYFAVNKKTNKIVDGWEIVDDVESLKYYAKMDLEDNDLNPKDYNLLSAKTLKSRGIDPYSWDSWAKTGEYAEGGETKTK